MIESGQCSSDELFKLIGTQETIWVRVAATRNNETWESVLLEVTAGGEPPNFSISQWKYELAVFNSSISTGKEVKKWLESNEIILNDVRIKLNFNQEQQITWYRHESRSSYAGYDVLEWSFTLYEQTYTTQRQIPSFSLISENSPSFVGFAEAVSSFFGITNRNAILSNQSKFVFRMQDCSGKIESIKIDTAEMTVTVVGESLDGMKLELASATPGLVEILKDDQSEPVRFELQNGLPPSSWVVLKKGSQCIDRKFINHPYTQTDSSVEFIAESSTILEALISGGEGSSIEFKCEVPVATDARKKLCRTIAAFANGEGGHLLFGVDDDGKLLGLPADDVTQHKQDAITQFVKNLVDPLPEFDIEVIALENEKASSVIILNVGSGDSPPYGVKWTATNTKYYVRRGATTFEASQEQVRTLARTRPPVEVDQAGYY